MSLQPTQLLDLQLSYTILLFLFLKLFLQFCQFLLGHLELCVHLLLFIFLLKSLLCILELDILEFEAQLGLVD